MKISERTAKRLFAPTVGLFMSFAMSFALTWINLGLEADFIGQWLRSFGISFLVALPISWFVVPRIQKFYDGITEKNESRNNANRTKSG
ncbi:MAG TPA: DUF2798 domain-containing protein [Pyrinomonadaceae bacterium]|nr:DUF2798 domain-containing protein [Pyrinomonadaceae bacterium]